jgi:DNA helicase-2/ATP-dependent DNA helicase PcrA
MSTGSSRELEEERRLFYVALTRARKQATFSYALNRYKWGNLERSNPSRFLRELDLKYIDYPQTGGKPGRIKGAPEDNLPKMREERVTMSPPPKLRKIQKQAETANHQYNEAAGAGFSEGDRVHHERFGNGIIVIIDGVPPNQTATVDFENQGTKKLLLRFAKLTRVE